LGNRKTNPFYEKLGMDFNRARRILFKSILFKLVKSTKQDKCYRCKKKILSVDDLTIDHKLPWLDVDVELFWDLNNIAFSHHICNSKAFRPYKR
jgi:hypothetical protein